MKAIVYRQYGGPEVLEVTEADDPKVGPDSVLIDVKAASVNPVDWKLREGYLDAVIDAFFPVTPGWDLAGVVVQPGISVPEFQPGDEVIGYARQDVLRHGTFAERVAAPVRALARKPRNVSWTEAAGIPLAGLTAYQALVHRMGVGKDDTVLVHAASGGVGALAVQIARARGARVIGTASQRNHEFLRSLGAEPVVYGDGMAERVRELVPDGATAILDLVGGEALAATPQVGADKVRVVSIVDTAVADYGGSYLFVRPDPADLSALVELVEAGEMTVPVERVFPLEETAEAQRRNAEGHTRGKIAVEIG